MKKHFPSTFYYERFFAYIMCGLIWGQFIRGMCDYNMLNSTHSKARNGSHPWALSAQKLLPLLLLLYTRVDAWCFVPDFSSTLFFKFEYIGNKFTCPSSRKSKQAQTCQVIYAAVIQVAPWWGVIQNGFARECWETGCTVQMCPWK